MGACCTKEGYGGGYAEDYYRTTNRIQYEDDVEEEESVRYGDGGARIRLQGCSRYISMYTQQGRKGINQDSMTVWEDFTEKDMFFCGVFDGHGPDGHKVSRCVRDNLPSKLSQIVKIYQLNTGIFSDVRSEVNQSYSSKKHQKKVSQDLSLPSWEASFVKSFMDMDEELNVDRSIDSFCSGSTAVTVVKQGGHLVIANLGDSRAILGTKSGEKNQIIPVQLTVDLKPDIPSESERILRCKGRILSVDEEPAVSRLWMPDEDCPGLAMARAFGDFCVKDYGLISTPEVFFRRISSNDEFVVLATDGVWDALTNNDVVKIVASARKRSMAAELLVKRAVRAWKRKYPESKIDDCAVIVLYLKDPPSMLTQSASQVSRLGKAIDSELSLSYYSSLSKGPPSEISSKMTEDLQGSVVGSAVGSTMSVDSKDTILKLPRYNHSLSWRKTQKEYEEVEAH